MKKKGLILVLAVILLLASVGTGTLAWLTAKSDTVTNTFTTSDINIELTETEGGSKKEFTMIPGWTIAKDPKVKVKTDSEECFLFVKLEKSSNFDTFMTYEMADGWTALSGVDGVYYREVLDSGMNIQYDVLKGNQVTVKGTVTKEMMNELQADPTKYPTLKITAYASQLYKTNGVKFTALEAWNVLNPTPTPGA